MNAFDELRADVRFYHSLRYPGRAPSWWTLARLVFGSRGLLLLAEHRVRVATAGWNPGGPWGAIWRGLRRVASPVLDYLTGVVTKSEVRLSCRLEGRLYLPDRGRVFLGASRIGDGTIVHDHVTIGQSMIDKGRPDIGRNVWIGPRTIVAGGVRVGDGVTILSDTVLTRSVPTGFVVGGNPAELVRRGFDNSVLRRSLETDVEGLVKPRAGEASPGAREQVGA